jgi:hypothetical protein
MAYLTRSTSRKRRDGAAAGRAAAVWLTVIPIVVWLFGVGFAIGALIALA